MLYFTNNSLLNINSASIKMGDTICSPNITGTLSAVPIKHSSGLLMDHIYNAVDCLPRDSVLLDIGSGDGTALAGIVCQTNRNPFQHVMAYEPNANLYKCTKPEDKNCDCKKLNKVQASYFTVQDIDKCLNEHNLSQNLSMSILYPYNSDENSTQDLDMIKRYKPRSVMLLHSFIVDKKTADIDTNISGSDDLIHKFALSLYEEETPLGYKLKYLKRFFAVKDFGEGQEYVIIYIMVADLTTHVLYDAKSAENIDFKLRHNDPQDSNDNNDNNDKKDDNGDSNNEDDGAYDNDQAVVLAQFEKDMKQKRNQAKRKSKRKNAKLRKSKIEETKPLAKDQKSDDAKDVKIVIVRPPLDPVVESQKAALVTTNSISTNITTHVSQGENIKCPIEGCTNFSCQVHA